MPERLTLQQGAAPVTVRHIRLATGDGAVTVLGQSFLPNLVGHNGRRGHQGGQYTRALYQEGQFSLTYPNAGGEDGTLHRERFAIITQGQRTAGLSSTGAPAYAGGTYRPGDEWVEVYRAAGPGQLGQLLYVGTPLKATLARDTVQLDGADALWTLKKQRETAAAFWVHAPRDVFEHYTSAWQPVYAQDFAGALSITANDSAAHSAGAGLGLFTYTRSALDAAHPGTLLMTSPATTGATVYTTTGVPFGPGSTDPHAAHRFEMSGYVSAWGGAGAYGGLILSDIATGQQAAGIWISNNAGTYVVQVVSMNAQIPIRTVLTLAGPPAGQITFAIEQRGRWQFFYYNGTLVFSCVTPPGAYTTVRHTVYMQGGTTTGTTSFNLDSVLHRRTQPYLMRGGDKGDYRMPGAPVPGGLQASYYSDQDIIADAALVYMRLVPTRQPYATRIDSAQMDAGATYGVPPPAGYITKALSARWTGSVYLDLANHDYAVRANVNGAAASLAAIRIGKTRVGEDYTTGFSYGGSLRSVFGSVSGWYPIVIESAWDATYAGATPSMLLFWKVDGGTEVAVPTQYLSPQGIYQKQSRMDSFYECLRDVYETTGLQFTCTPQSLESGLFPGQVVPRVREGRDTEYVVDTIEATDMQVTLSADQTADTLIVDAQGIADPNGTAQLTAESVNYAQLGQHLMVSSEYDSLGDIAVAALLRQRADSLLALRGNTWEDVGAVPQGTRQLADTFPLTGAAAEFAWLPGDGVRLVLPEISVEDAAPRQVLTTQWAFVPDGLGRPAIGFRQRPRGISEELRRMQRQLLVNDRTYQGQLVQADGALAGNSGAYDIYSRIFLPGDPSRIAAVWFDVIYKNDASGWRLDPSSGPAGPTINSVGRYDITALAVATLTGAGHVFYVGITALGGSTGLINGRVSALVRV